MKCRVVWCFPIVLSIAGWAMLVYSPNPSESATLKHGLPEPTRYNAGLFLTHKPCTYAVELPVHHFKAANEISSIKGSCECIVVTPFDFRNYQSQQRCGLYLQYQGAAEYSVANTWELEIRVTPVSGRADQIYRFEINEVTDTESLTNAVPQLVPQPDIIESVR